MTDDNLSPLAALEQRWRETAAYSDMHGHRTLVQCADCNLEVRRLLDVAESRVAELEGQIEMAREWAMNIHAAICESVNWPKCCATAVVITHLWPTRPDTETT